MRKVLSQISLCRDDTFGFHGIFWTFHQHKQFAHFKVIETFHGYFTYLTKSGAFEMTCSNSAKDRESSSSKSASSKICKETSNYLVKTYLFSSPFSGRNQWTWYFWGRWKEPYHSGDRPVTSWFLGGHHIHGDQVHLLQVLL